MGVSYYLISILVLILTAIYLRFKQSYKFWAKLSVPYLEPKFPLGNLQESIKNKHFSEITQNLYKKLKGQGDYGGIFFLNQPILFAIEPEFVKTILVRDFNSFMNRGSYFNKKDDPLSGNLFFLEGNEWKTLRQKLSPTFTSGRMKMMFNTTIDVANELIKYIENKCINQTETDVKDLMECFTIDIISSCVFGLEGNSITNPDSEFRRIGGKAIRFSKFKNLMGLVAIVYPEQARSLGFTIFHKESTEFFNQIVHKTIGFRKENNIHRNDLMQIMIEHMKLDCEIGEGLTIDEVSANAFIFFFGGYETSSVTLTFVLYNLALYQNIQEDARKEIEQIFKKYDGKLTYEGMMEFDLIERILFETLRMFPPISTVHRISTQPYKLPNDVEIPKGIQVLIPVYAIHHDEDNYPEPEKFDPERFTPQNNKTRHPYSYLPFGEGPRICIGQRFAFMQTKIGLAMILKNYRIEICEKTEIPIRIDEGGLTFGPKGNVWLKFVKI